MKIICLGLLLSFLYVAAGYAATLVLVGENHTLQSCIEKRNKMAKSASLGGAPVILEGFTYKASELNPIASKALGFEYNAEGNVFGMDELHSYAITSLLMPMLSIEQLYLDQSYPSPNRDYLVYKHLNKLAGSMVILKDNYNSFAAAFPAVDPAHKNAMADHVGSVVRPIFESNVPQHLVEKFINQLKSKAVPYAKNQLHAKGQRYDLDIIDYEAIKPLVNALMSPASDFDFAYQTYYYNFPYRNHFMAENIINAMKVVENHETLCDATVHAFVGRQHIKHLTQLLCDAGNCPEKVVDCIDL
ncbi:MAG: hypothetical protein KDK51_01215 [Deltaproteobacteria bacterium]|nr:hypothetical protein [Deltaproteobacteria bacterium]